MLRIEPVDRPMDAFSSKSCERLPERMPPATKKTKKSRDQLKEVIVASASRLFAERGFTPPTLREITKDAGVSLPIVYWFFADKRALYKHCCQEVLDSDLDLLAFAVEGLRDPVEVVYCALLTTCEIMRRNGGTAIIHRLMLENDAEILTMFAKMLNERGLYRKFDRALARLPSEKTIRWLALTAMCAGLSEFFYFFDKMPGMSKVSVGPSKLAEYVLDLLFPEIDWSGVGKKLSARAAEIMQAV